MIELDEIDEEVDDGIAIETDQRGPGMAQVVAEKGWDETKRWKLKRLPIREICIYSPFAKEVNGGVNIESLPTEGLLVEIEGEKLRLYGTIANPIPGLISRNTSAGCGSEIIAPGKLFSIVPSAELLPAPDPYNTFISKQIGKACRDMDKDGMVVFRLVLNESTILILRTDQPSTP